jgi:tetratricopeptide (TPR) repeat protein
VLREFGFLQADLYDYGLALSTLQQAAKRLPADGELKKAIAECLFRLHRYEESLAAYEEVVAAGADADTYDSYTTLAESLGKPDKVIAGLQGKLASTNLVAGMDYMRLAHLHARQGQTNQMRQAMQVGLSRFPEDPGLRLQLANALSDQRQWLEAARTLAPHPDLRTDPEIGGMYLSLLVQAQDFRSAAAYLASKPSPAVTNSVGYLEAAAQVHESEKAFETTLSIYARLRAERPDELRHTLNYGRMLAVLNRQKEAEAILHSLLGHTEPEVLKLAAEVYTAARKYRLAEQYQKRYLATNPPELHKEYGFLGDIRLSRGDKVNARRAYQRGLDHLYAKLAAEKGPAVSGLVRP